MSRSELALGLSGDGAWVVEVSGTEPYTATPHPWAADNDSDGLDDAEELEAGTDPNLADTDGDELEGTSGSDAHEQEVGRDPLRKDQRVSVTYDSLNIGASCDDGTEANVEIYGSLYIDFPGGGRVTYTCSNCCQRGSCAASANNTATFVLAEGASFTLSTNTWTETDSFWDDGWGSFSQAFPYPVASESQSRLDFTGGDDCDAFWVYYHVEVD